jgi:ERCC4-type nuclease
VYYPLETVLVKLTEGCWVAKLKPEYKSQHSALDDEVMLDYLIERKAGSDLLSSIMDSRYM